MDDQKSKNSIRRERAKVEIHRRYCWPIPIARMPLALTPTRWWPCRCRSASGFFITGRPMSFGCTSRATKRPRTVPQALSLPSILKTAFARDFGRALGQSDTRPCSRIRLNAWDTKSCPSSRNVSGGVTRFRGRDSAGNLMYTVFSTPSWQISLTRPARTSPVGIPSPIPRAAVRGCGPRPRLITPTSR